MSTAAFDYAGLVAHAPPRWVFKQDRRSRVWQLDGPDGPLVAKEFRHFGARQAIAKLLGRHPGQREAVRHEELRSKGLPVVPILAHGFRWAGLGGRYWLVTPLAGRSIHAMAKQGDLENPRRRKVIVDAVADLTAELILHGLTNRDHKTSNLVIDDANRLWLIDGGAVAPAKRGRPDTLRMLAILNKTLAKDEIPHAERRYLLARIVKRCDFLGDVERLMADVEATKLPPG